MWFLAFCAFSHFIHSVYALHSVYTRRRMPRTQNTIECCLELFLYRTHFHFMIWWKTVLAARYYNYIRPNKFSCNSMCCSCHTLYALCDYKIFTWIFSLFSLILCTKIWNAREKEMLIKMEEKQTERWVHKGMGEWRIMSLAVAICVLFAKLLNLYEGSRQQAPGTHNTNDTIFILGFVVSLFSYLWKLDAEHIYDCLRHKHRPRHIHSPEPLCTKLVVAGGVNKLNGNK